METLSVAVKAKDFMTAAFGRMGKSVVAFERNAIRSTKAIGGGFRNLFNAVTSLRTLVLGFFAGKIAQGIGRFITSTADFADSIAKLNERIGLTPELLSEMQFAAERSGIEFTVLTTGFQRAIRRMDEFRTTGKGIAAGALKELGGGLAEAVQRGEDFETLLPLLSDRFQALGADATRVRVAMALFDTEGVKLVQLLRQGSEGVEELRRQAREFGITLDQDAVSSAAAFNDALSNFKASIRGVKQTLVVELLPLLTKELEKFANFIKNNRQEIVKFFLDSSVSILELSESLVEFAASSRTAFNTWRVAKLWFNVVTLDGDEALDIVNRMNKGDETDFSAMREGLRKAKDRIREFREELEKAASAPQPGQMDLSGIRFGSVPDFAKDLDLTPMLSTFDRLSIKAGEFTGKLNDGLRRIGETEPFALLVEKIEDVGEFMVEKFGKSKDESIGFLEAFRQEAAVAIENIGFTIGSRLSDALISVADGTKKAKEAFKDMAKAILADLARIAIQTAITRAFSGIAGGVSGAAKGGVFPGSLQPVSGRLQAGGVASRRGLFELREGGQNEAVVPLPDNRHIPVEIKGGGRGGQMVVIQPTVTFNSNFVDARGQQRMIQDNEDQIAGIVTRRIREDFAFAQNMRNGQA